MGKAIHEIAKEKNERLGKKLYDISLIIDIDNRKSITKEDLKKVDVAIEFTSPHTAVDNIKWCFDADVPVVVGSTAWTTDICNSFGKRAFWQHFIAIFAGYFYFPIIGFDKTTKYEGPSHINDKLNNETSISKTKKITKPILPKRSFAREWADAILFAVVAATIIRTFVIEAYIKFQPLPWKVHCLPVIIYL